MRLVERREPDETVRSALRLEDPVRVLAVHDHRRGLQASLLPRARLEHLGLKAAAFSPALIHAQQHLRPILGVRAAAAGLDRHDCVARVVLAVEERVLLQPLELLAQRLQRRLDLRRHVAVHREQVAGVFVLAPQPVEALEPPRQARVLGGNRRRVLLVVPEPWFGELLLELGDACR